MRDDANWSPRSHLGALTDSPGPTSGKLIPGKSRRITKPATEEADKPCPQCGRYGADCRC